eukprot:COSAG01_NODE_860_length_13064_cov_23.466949_5_plen_96_part_00
MPLTPLRPRIAPMAVQPVLHHARRLHRHPPPTSAHPRSWARCGPHLHHLEAALAGCVSTTDLWGQCGPAPRTEQAPVRMQDPANLPPIPSAHLRR